MVIFIEKIAKLKTGIIVFMFGGFTYGTLEILWRGFTHPAMLALGGVCFFVVYCFEKKLKNKIILPIRSLYYALMITAAEFGCGLLLNVYLGLNVWDYSVLPYNFMGQICLGFFLLWYVLAIVCCFTTKIIRYAFD